MSEAELSELEKARKDAADYYWKYIGELDDKRLDNEGYEFFIRRAIIRLDDPEAARVELEHLLEKFVCRGRDYVRNEDLDMTQLWNRELYAPFEHK